LRECCGESCAGIKTAEPFQRKLTSRSDVEARKRHAAAKKKARRMIDAPSNKTYLATACWDFIVFKRTGPDAAPMLDFSSLQGANSQFHPQIIHKCLWMRWGQFQGKHP
jgi:hypothetical protein